ncbi:MAG: DUF3825 domain-containing protein [Oscillospiraceae bacterium]|jgi:hypothetical protein|nr:DUF3825 domain-containing protein [Oscillospiraceae bacterium]
MAGKRLASLFNPLPQQAKYFEKITDLLYELGDSDLQDDDPEAAVEEVQDQIGEQVASIERALEAMIQ